MAKNQNQANDYRAERKKRLAKNSKNSKKIVIDSVTLISGIITTLIVIVAVIGSAILANGMFDISYKILPAVKVDDQTYTAAEYGFYYTSVFNAYAGQTNSLGVAAFDYSKDPDVQTTEDEDGNTITYHELFKQKALENISTTSYYLKECNAKGITLDEEHQKEVDDLISELSANADNYGVSLSKYIAMVYGRGLSAKTFTKLITEQYLVAQYIETIEEECHSNITDEDLEKAYEEDPSEYESVDIRLFGFEIPEKKDGEEAADISEIESLANKMLNAITDEASFSKLAYEYAEEEDKTTFKNDTATLAKSIKKSVVTSNIGEDVAEWLYSDERAEGDKNVFTSKNIDYVYVIYIIKPSYRNEEPLVDARHILISFDEVAASLKKEEGNKIDVEKKDDAEVESTVTEDAVTITNEGTGYSIELVNEAYKLARDVYDKYMSGNKTEAAFAVLAEKYSADTGSVSSKSTTTSSSTVEYTEENIPLTTANIGGLYNDIERGAMVAPFEDWVYDAERKTGDVDLVMTNYGWHIMYFVNRDTEPAWKIDVRTSLGNKAFEELSEKLTEEIADDAVEATFYDYATKKALQGVNERY